MLYYIVNQRKSVMSGQHYSHIAANGPSNVQAGDNFGNINNGLTG